MCVLDGDIASHFYEVGLDVVQSTIKQSRYSPIDFSLIFETKSKNKGLIGIRLVKMLL